MPLSSASPACTAPRGSDRALCLCRAFRVTQGHHHPEMQLPVCRTWQPFMVLRNASQGGKKQRPTVEICRMANVRAFVQSSSDAAPSFQKTSGQQRGSPSGKTHLGAVAKRQSLCVLLHTQHAGKASGSAQTQKGVLLSCSTPLSTMWVYPLYL